MTLTLYFIAVVIGAAILAWSAGRFIDSSIVLAKHFKLPPLVIGIVLVGLGTSFPEFVVSLFASIRGSSEIAIGNVVGSNSANIGLVLGFASILTPIAAHSRLILRELPILILVSLLLGILFYNHYLSRLDGIILILVFILYLYLMLGKRFKNPDDLVPEDILTTSFSKALMWWVIGLILLLGGSELFVRGAIGIAHWFHISELIIGLTIVTIGTSLPELAATVVSALKKQYDIAIGHIVGSNIFNSLMVLSMPALIHPTKLPKSLFRRDYPVMFGFTLIMWIMLFLSPKKQIGRIVGALLFSAYILYLIVLAYS